MKMCVSELQNQLQDLNTSTNKKLIQSASKEHDNLSSQLSHYSCYVDPNTNETDHQASSVQRHNPFNTFNSEESFERDSFVMDHYSGGKEARDFLEMHEDIGRQIKEIMEEYMNQQHNSQHFMGDSLV